MHLREIGRQFDMIAGSKVKALPNTCNHLVRPDFHGHLRLGTGRFDKHDLAVQAVALHAEVLGSYAISDLVAIMNRNPRRQRKCDITV